jgi:hypothetical protein
MKQILLCVWVCTAFFTAAAQPPALRYRVYTGESSVYAAAPDGVFAYSTDSRTLRPIVLDETRTRDSIVDITESDGVLWVLTPGGIFQYDMATSTAEKLPGFEGGVPDGKIGADYDYVWLASSDTLYQYDKLGREWTPHPVPPDKHSSPDVLGAAADGEAVYCVYGDGVLVFSVDDEKWTPSPLGEGPLSRGTQFFNSGDNLLLVNGATIYRYILEARSWEVIRAEAPVVDIIPAVASSADNASLYFLTSQRAWSYSAAASITRRLDIGRIAQPTVFAHYGDSTLAFVAGNNIALVNVVTQQTEFITCPADFSGEMVRKLVKISSLLLAVIPERLLVYDTRNEVWESTDLAAGAAAGRRLSWNDEGLAAGWARGYSTTLKGSAEKSVIFTDTAAVDTSISYNRQTHAYDTTFDTIRLAYTDPEPRLNLTLHSSFPERRYLDLYFNNAEKTKPVRKGVYYRGSERDIAQIVSAGALEFDLPPSRTMQAARFEGAGAVLESPQKLAARDRKIVRLQGGGGFLTTQTRCEVLPYDSSNSYVLGIAHSFKDTIPDTIRIVPGSMRLWIDGEEIDTTLYAFGSARGKIKLNREDLADPSSVISVSYEVETVPDSGITRVEPLPDNNFGPLAYGDLTVSPWPWLSARTGLLRTGRAEKRHEVLNLSTPVEVRGEQLLLKLDPEFAYDIATGSKAGSVGIRSRLGRRTSLLFNSLLADTSYVSTDHFQSDIGVTKRDYDAKLTYDIFENAPVSYRQKSSRATRGARGRYELSAGAHLPGYPFADLTVSRDITDGAIATAITTADTTDTASVETGADTLSDTITIRKDKVRLRLYETSSNYLSRVLRLKSYDFSVTVYRTEDLEDGGKGSGRILYGKSAFTPMQALTITAEGTYLNNPSYAAVSRQLVPLLRFQATEFPRGLDLSGSYGATVVHASAGDSSVSTVSRTFTAVARPGAWFAPLGWFSPRTEVTHKVRFAAPRRSMSWTNALAGVAENPEKTFSRTAGVHVFPTADILLINSETLSDKPDKSRLFSSFNDCTFWFRGRKLLWQTRWLHDNDFEQTWNNDAFTSLENQWTAALSTASGMYATHAGAASDSGVLRQSSAGPRAAFKFNKGDFHILKKIAGATTFDARWLWKNEELSSSKPDLGFTMDLWTTIKPNLLITALNQVLYSPGAAPYKVKDYRGEFKGQLVF